MVHKRQFDRYLGIDYSGAGRSDRPQAGIRVFLAEGRMPVAVKPAHHGTVRRSHWSRCELADWLSSTLDAGVRTLVGIDHGFGFPDSYLERFRLRSWDQFLADFQLHWPTHQPGTTVEDFRGPGQVRRGDPGDRRLTELWTAGTKSVFQFDVQGSVAKSTHAGLPFLRQLRDAHCTGLHVWPFDGWTPAEGKSVMVEVFPSLFRNRYPRDGRTVDEQDAYATARWMQEMDLRGCLTDFFHPPLSSAEQRQARREGWILGVY